MDPGQATARARERDCFRLIERPAPACDGDVVVRSPLLSCDPTQRGWISRDTYLSAIAIGEVVRSGAAGRVVASNAPAFAVGDLVMGMLGWHDYALVESDGPKPIPCSL
jgi:NADPH-dependent curcumin reductase